MHVICTVSVYFSNTIHRGYAMQSNKYVRTKVSESSSIGML